MPCTRSMVRSTSNKPSRSRSGGDGDSDMPPPPSTPPKSKARVTRSKKVSKKTEDDVSVSESDCPKSPATSTSSTRSTRNRARSKVVEEVAPASPLQPQPKPTRSTRQKQAKPSTASSSVRSRVDSAVVVLTPLGKLVDSKSTSRTLRQKKETAASAVASTSKATKRTRSRATNQQSVESETEELSTEEGEAEIKRNRNLTLDELHKYHVTPLKTALDLSVCEVYPRCMAKLMDDETAKKVDEAFDKLKNRTEMPPPPPPQAKGKGKGRKKRARSPEATPQKTNVPASFDFAVSKVVSNPPAHKKMLLDTKSPEGTTPVTMTKTVTEVDEVSAVEENSEKVVKKNEIVNESSPKSHKEDEDYSELQQEAIKEEEFKKAQSEVVDVVVKKSKKTKKGKVAKDEANISDKTATSASATTPVEETPMENKMAKKKDNKKTKGLPEELVPSVNENEVKVEADIVERDTKDTKKPQDSEVVISVDSTRKKSTESRDVDINEIKTPTPTTSKNAVPCSAEKKEPALDQTYVFETPKDESSNGDIPINTTFTPELFVSETPKSSRTQRDQINETIVISRDDVSSKKSEVEDMDCSPDLGTPDSGSIDTNNMANGKVSSLVNFFDKNKKKEANINGKAVSGNKDGKLEPQQSLTPNFSEVNNQDPNATYVLLSAKPEKKSNQTSLMNVTVCVKKASFPDATPKSDSKVSVIPTLPSASVPSDYLPDQDSQASRTFVKEPPSLGIVLEEDEGKDGIDMGKKSDKLRTMVKASNKDVVSKKGISSSSSSSNSSMKSASSQPCLVNKNKLTASSKNGPSYGSAGKLNEVYKSKPLEEAEKRRQELLQQRVENNKKKMEEWKKKTEKNKLEEEKKLKEKLKAVQASSSGSTLKKLAPAPTMKVTDSAAVSSFPKPKPLFGMPALKVPNAGPSNFLPPLSKHPFHKQVHSTQPNDLDMDESFKTAGGSSFLDTTTDGHLSSYDITVYEDLDEDLKHRENKTVPQWASDKEALKVALFSMVYLPEYQYKMLSNFPKPDKSYKLFPTRTINH